MSLRLKFCVREEKIPQKNPILTAAHGLPYQICESYLRRETNKGAYQNFGVTQLIG